MPERDWRDISYLLQGTSRQRSAYHAIQNIKILEVLASFDPILVSTVCLAIDIPTSDLDVVCYAPDLGLFEEHVRAAFGTFDRFRCQQGEIPQKRVVASFWAQDFEFEVYGCEEPTERQRAFKHLQQAARVVEAGGECAREKIRELKLSGMKTEPAIAALLELPGDPYQAILNLERYSDEALAALCRIIR